MTLTKEAARAASKHYPALNLELQNILRCRLLPTTSKIGTQPGERFITRQNRFTNQKLGHEIGRHVAGKAVARAKLFRTIRHVMFYLLKPCM